MVPSPSPHTVPLQHTTCSAETSPRTRASATCGYPPLFSDFMDKNLQKTSKKPPKSSVSFLGFSHLREHPHSIHHHLLVHHHLPIWRFPEIASKKIQTLRAYPLKWKFCVYHSLPDKIPTFGH